MGLIKRLTGRASFSGDVPEEADNPPENPRTTQRTRSIVESVPLSEISEASLRVFRQLPTTIRHDPSMISFQQEHEKWKGELIIFR